MNRPDQVRPPLGGTANELTHRSRVGTDVSVAVRILREGGIVALPTETVYGLGADASNPDAVSRVFALKGRPEDHPLIVHIGGVDDIGAWAIDVPEEARLLAERFWPGPLTAILKRHPGVLDVVTGGQDTVGLRVPDHPLTLELLAEFGHGVAAPSANRFGRVSPTCASHVDAEFGDGLDYVLDGGACRVGLESTIVDFSAGGVRILRPGAVTVEDIASVIGDSFVLGSESSETHTPRVPGSLASHYSPDTPVRAAKAEDLERSVASALNRGLKVCVMHRSPAPKDAHLNGARWVRMPEGSDEYGRALYAILRELDTPECDLIVVEAVPDSPRWAAARDRLSRAAEGDQAEDAGP